MNINRNKKKSPIKSLFQIFSAVLVSIFFLMAGSCPGGGNGSAEGPHILITQGATIILPVIGTHNFGDTLISFTDYDVTFTISSVGDQALNLTGTPNLVSITGDPEFTVQSQPPLDALDPGNTTDFIIRLRSAAGSGFPITYTADVTVESNDPDVPSYTFEVTGTMTSSS
jgi:hypothetical protein